MPVEQTISEIVNNYGSVLISGVVITILTIFIMNSIKNFAVNLVNYLTVKLSNLGFNAMIYWNGTLYKVVEINFTEIEITDEKTIIFIPIDLWIKSPKKYPVPGLEQYKEHLWDGTERRQ